MNPCFADTFFFLALLNRDDAAHELAVRTRESGRRTVTTDFVLVDLGEHLCDRRNRGLFVAFYDFLDRSPTTEIIRVSDDLVRRGRQLYVGRPDKDWSLTDCISFVVMTDRGITEALTGDHHFEQAGFKAILK